MVLLPLRQAPDAWEVLRGAASDSHRTLLSLPPCPSESLPGPVLVFCAANDVDALVSIRILTALLKADLTRYEVHPVAGYQHLATKFTDLVPVVKPRAVLLVNCGGMVDLETIFNMNANQQHSDTVRVFVMDCHRPWHLKNIRSDKVVLFHDVQDIAEDALPLDVDWEDEWGNVPELLDNESSDDDSSDDDLDHDAFQEHDQHDDSIGSDKSTAPRRKRKRRRRQTSQIDEEDDVVFDDDHRHRNVDDNSHHDNEDQSGIDDSRAPSTSDHDAPDITPRRRRRKLRRRQRFVNSAEEEERQRLREYYSNATIAMSSACLSHSIASVMRRSSLDTLWMAIVGVTSQYMANMISHDLYEDSLGYFAEQVKMLTQTPEEEDEQTSAVANVGYAPGACRGYQVDRIAPNVELRLDLLRHWSLHESLIYSTYTATRLSAWRQTGKRRLLEMLATLGIPVKESQQEWCYMKAKNKRALEKHLDTAVQRFDLGEKVRYDSFVRSLPGHRGDISAADFAHAVSALLEFGEPYRENEEKRRALEMRFWSAYDALDSKRGAKLETGLGMAKSVQKLTASVGGSVVELRKFVPGGPFRYVFLRDHECKEMLAHPLLLRRLALFLIKALGRQGMRDKPFIVLAPDGMKEEWVAVAATTSGQRNDFGGRFRKAAEQNGSRVVYDGFDAGVCRIKEGQEVEFVRFLHDVLR